MIQTTELCEVYNEGKGSSNRRRMMAAELYGIISKYLCVMQIYIEGIAFANERITGNFEGLMSFINGNSLNHQKLVNDKVEESVGSCFKQALQYMDTKRDSDRATAYKRNALQKNTLSPAPNLYTYSQIQGKVFKATNCLQCLPSRLVKSVGNCKSRSSRYIWKYRKNCKLYKFKSEVQNNEKS